MRLPIPTTLVSQRGPEVAMVKNDQIITQDNFQIYTTTRFDPLLRHITSFYVRLFFSPARRGAHFGVGWAAGPRSSWTFLLLKRSISTDTLLYRNRSRSACVARPCLTCFLRFA